jgi:hypothetical protein
MRALLLAALVLPAKKVVGIADAGEIAVLDKFCFTIPDDAHKGQIKSQIIVNKPNQHFLVLNSSAFDAANGDCAKLKSTAKVVEPLMETNREVISYDLTLAVEKKLTGETLLAVMVNCGNGDVSGQYILDFTNPDGSFDTQFSCRSIGLIWEFFFFTACVLLLAPSFIYCEQVLSRRQVLNETTALFFAAAAAFVLHIFLFTIHIGVYSMDGSGLIVLCFLSELFDGVQTCLLTLVATLVTHGVSISRADYTLEVEAHRRLCVVVCALALFSILSALNHGFHEKDDLNPFGWMRTGGFVTSCLLFTRVVAGAFVYQRGMVTSKNEAIAGKREFMVNFACMYACWLTSAPVIYTLTSEWRNAVFRIEVVNFAAYGTLLFYLWPTRFGQIFTAVQATQSNHPYNEFGLD